MRIKDICESITDGSHNPPQGGDISEFLMISSKNIFDDHITLDEPRYLTEEQFFSENKRTNISAGDVLMTIVGTVGRAAVVPVGFTGITLQRSVAVLHPRKEKCDSRYLMYALQSKRSTFEKEAHGVAQKGIYLKQLADIDIDLPDIAEQTRVVGLLDKINGVINKRRDEIELLDNIIKARFVEMFGNPELNEKGWKTCRLGDKCIVINGRAYKAEELLDEGKYRVLRVGNFFTNDSWYYSDLELDNDKYCEEGDLLFAWSASFGPRIWHGEKVVYHYHIWKLVGYEAYFNKDFFVELLKYNCDVMKRGTHGSTMLHLTKTQMENQKLIVPPIEVQNQFAEFVNRVDKSKVVIQKSLDETQLLFDSLMQKYFG